MLEKKKTTFCSKCGKDASVLHIKCVDCDSIELCLQCFSSGAEVEEHLKTHKYTIIDNGTFTLFGTTWTAEEELILVDSVEQFGLGNWDEVAANIPNKSASEVEEHYMVTYIDGYLGRSTVPPNIPNRMTDHTPPIHESSFSIVLPQVGVNKSQQQEIAYMPNRDDFEYEYDNEAETSISSLFMNPDESDLDKGLKLAKVGMYHSRLMERQRRKDIAREYGLVDKFFRKDGKVYQTKYEKEVRFKLRSCSQFMKGSQSDKLLKGLVKERQLKRKIARLKNYRKNGLSKFEECISFDAAQYERDQKSESGEKSLSNISEKTNKADKRLFDLKCQPEYNLLCNGERQLCTNLKITPSMYLTAKVLIVKDFILKQHSSQTKSRYSAVIEKTQRRRILSHLKDNSWL